jgi:hypothetical protein
MNLAQSSTLMPFMGHLIAFSSIATGARDNDIFRAIRPAAIKWNDVIGVILATYGLVTVITLSLLKSILSLYIESLYIANCLLLARPIPPGVIATLIGVALLVFLAALKKASPMALSALLYAFPVFIWIAFTKPFRVQAVLLWMILFVLVAALTFANSTATTQTIFFVFVGWKEFNGERKRFSAFGTAFLRGIHGAFTSRNLPDVVSASGGKNRCSVISLADVNIIPQGGQYAH